MDLSGLIIFIFLLVVIWGLINLMALIFGIVALASQYGTGSIAAIVFGAIAILVNAFVFIASVSDPNEPVTMIFPLLGLFISIGALIAGVTSLKKRQKRPAPAPQNYTQSQPGQDRAMEDPFH